MSTPDPPDDAVRELIMLFPRLVSRAKRIVPPAQLQAFNLAPRHRSLMSLLLLDGPQTVSQLADRLEVAPTTVSLLVSDLSRKGVLIRHEDDADRRRRIVDIAPDARDAISEWLSPFAAAWRRTLAPLTPAERRLIVDTLLAYEAAVADG
ncbi:MarR family winged helix-turn-helix transcriptional regulator [Actinoplanes sp. NPDC026619]|uniref:MarR family winged helix-turn-helix transcriptional regulator n=1 Tax=Actinoplanes sp. NPDC026619 TaxID=3155798 RepID=UPI0033C04A06